MGSWKICLAAGVDEVDEIVVRRQICPFLADHAEAGVVLVVVVWVHVTVEVVLAAVVVEACDLVVVVAEVRATRDHGFEVDFHSVAGEVPGKVEESRLLLSKGHETAAVVRWTTAEKIHETHDFGRLGVHSTEANAHPGPFPSVGLHQSVIRPDRVLEGEDHFRLRYVNANFVAADHRHCRHYYVHQDRHVSAHQHIH